MVYPVIEESEKTDLKAATTMFEMLAAGPFANRRLALLHGRMAAIAGESARRRGDEATATARFATTLIKDPGIFRRLGIRLQPRHCEDR